MNKSTIELAEDLIDKGEYNQAQIILLDKIVSYTDNHYYYFLVAYTYFVTKDFGNSLKFFSKSLSINEDADDAKLFVAVVHLHNYNVTLSMKYWLELLEKNNNKYALRAIGLVKNAEDADLAKMFSDPFKYKIIPPFRKKKKHKLLGTVLPIILLVSIVSFGLITISAYRRETLLQQEKTNEREAQLVQVITKNLDQTKVPLYPIFLNFTGAEIDQKYKQLTDSFLKFEDNKVLQLANEILYANASNERKIKTEYIVESLPEADYTKNIVWPTAEEILQNPLIYRNVTSKFKGTTTNIVYDVEGGQGEFLVDYYGENAQLTTLIPIVFSSNIELQNGDEIEVFVRAQAENIDDPSSIVFFVNSFRYLLRK